MNRFESCACGCGASVRDRRYGTRWASESCRKAFLHGRAPANASKSRPRARSGRQVSYSKAVACVADYLRGTVAQPTVAAEAILWPALPERQRRAAAAADAGPGP